MFKLRDYQEEILSLIRKSYLKYKKIVAVAPTRSGKTIIFSDISKKMENNSKRVLILTHREEIFEQTFKKLCDYKISPGQIRTGKALSKNLIQVAMIQTLHNHLKKQEKIKKKYGFKKVELFKKPDLIIIDECHHAISKTWKAVLEYFNDVPRIGFTATPERLDGSGLCELFDSLVIGKSIQWMVDNYWLAKPIHLCPPSPLDKEKIKSSFGDYDKKSQSEIMKKHIVCAEVVKSYRKFFNGAPVIVFCCTIEHAEQMVIEYKADGWNAISIHGKMNKTDRIDAMEGFRIGKYQLLVSVDLIGEGVDVPACVGIQVLRKTKSLGLYLQMFARGLTPIYADDYNLENINERKAALEKGKPESIILDHAGNYWVHGSILKERDWSIDHKKREKKQAEIKKISCPQCFFDWEFETKICPNCGYDFQQAIKAKKQFEMHELKQDLVNVNNFEEKKAESLAKIILRIKDYKNSKNAMFAILHNSIRYEENDLKDKIDAMCNGLGYDNKYKFRVWNHLRTQYGERLDRLS